MPFGGIIELLRVLVEVAVPPSWWTENVAIAVVGMVGVVSTAAAGVLIAMVQRNTTKTTAAAAHAKQAAANAGKAAVAAVLANEQVSNTHTTNLREELDERDAAHIERHADLVGKVDIALELLAGVTGTLNRLADADLEQTKASRILTERQTAHEAAVAERIDSALRFLEDTQPSRPTPPGGGEIE